MWKSNSQKFKDVTFFQTGRRGRDAKTLGKVQRCGDAEQVVPRLHVVDKNWEGCLRGRDPSPTPDIPAHSSSAREVSHHNFWL